MCLEDHTANASIWREPRQPPASNRRDGAAVYVEDQTANASTWREPRQPPASSWREAALFGQREARPLMQPHMSTGHVVHESCDRGAQPERFIVINDQNFRNERTASPIVIS